MAGTENPRTKAPRGWEIREATGRLSGCQTIGVLGTGGRPGEIGDTAASLAAVTDGDGTERTAILAMGVNPDLCSIIEKAAATAGREADFIEIRPGGSVKWNAVWTPRIDQRATGSALALRMDTESGLKTGRGRETATTRACIWILRMLRWQAGGWFNASSVLWAMTSRGDLEREVKRSMHWLLGGKADATDERLFHIPDETRRNRAAGLKKWHEEDWLSLDKKARGAAAHGARKALKPLMRDDWFQAFSPAMAPETGAYRLNRLYELSLETVSGRIIALRTPEGITEPGARTAAALLKLAWEEAIAAAGPQAQADERGRTTTRAAFICDDYGGSDLGAAPENRPDPFGGG